jgi:hypothetical protein
MAASRSPLSASRARAAAASAPGRCATRDQRQGANDGGGQRQGLRRNVAGIRRGRRGASRCAGGLQRHGSAQPLSTGGVHPWRCPTTTGQTGRCPRRGVPGQRGALDDRVSPWSRTGGDIGCRGDDVPSRLSSEACRSSCMTSVASTAMRTAIGGANGGSGTTAASREVGHGPDSRCAMRRSMLVGAGPMPAPGGASSGAWPDRARSADEEARRGATGR